MPQLNQSNIPTDGSVDQVVEKEIVNQHNKPCLSKTKLLIIIMAILAVVIVVGLVVYYIIVLGMGGDKKMTEEKNKNQAILGWGKYTDMGYGLEFNFPDSKKISLENNKIIISEGSLYWQIITYKNTNKQNLKKWFNDYFDKSKNNECKEIESNFNIETYESKMFSAPSIEDNCLNGGYYTISDDKSRIIKIIPGHDAGENFVEIISTIKFFDKPGKESIYLDMVACEFNKKLDLEENYKQRDYTTYPCYCNGEWIHYEVCADKSGPEITNVECKEGGIKRISNSRGDFSVVYPGMVKVKFEYLAYDKATEIIEKNGGKIIKGVFSTCSWINGKTKPSGFDPEQALIVSVGTNKEYEFINNIKKEEGVKNASQYSNSFFTTFDDPVINIP